MAPMTYQLRHGLLEEMVRTTDGRVRVIELYRGYLHGRTPMGFANYPALIREILAVEYPREAARASIANH